MAKVNKEAFKVKIHSFVPISVEIRHLEPPSSPFIELLFLLLRPANVAELKGLGAKFLEDSREKKNLYASFRNLVSNKQTKINYSFKYITAKSEIWLSS